MFWYFYKNVVCEEIPRQEIEYILGSYKINSGILLQHNSWILFQQKDN